MGGNTESMSYFNNYDEPPTVGREYQHEREMTTDSKQSDHFRVRVAERGSSKGFIFTTNEENDCEDGDDLKFLVCED